MFVVNDAAAQRPAAAKGVNYAVMDNGDLRWNRHDGRGDGSLTADVKTPGAKMMAIEQGEQMETDGHITYFLRCRTIFLSRQARKKSMADCKPFSTENNA